VAADRAAFPYAVIAITVAGLTAPVLYGPARGAAPGATLAWLLFAGSSVHVAATFALFSFADVRRHARQTPARYVVVPLVLVVTAATLAAAAPTTALSPVLLGFLGWQLWHYQQQNLGLAALAARATGAPPLTKTDRRCLRASGLAGILALVAHPSVTQLVDVRPPSLAAGVAFGAAGVLLTMSVATCATRRRRRPTAAAVVLLIGVAFPLPLLLSHQPYVALGGMTLAHGLQYLFLVGLVGAGPAGARPDPVKGVFVVAGVVALAGLLAATSHLHHGPAATRAIFGAYLGTVMTHFVVDAGLWRLRDAFPRRWLGQRLPTLLAPAPTRLESPRLAIHRAPV
jgi:uncharacterized protein YhhL (DUF1145 family)